VRVEVIAFEPDFDGIVMRMALVLRPPVAADELVLSDEVSFDCNDVHALSLFLCQRIAPQRIHG
jgi:hypothetical protein